MDKGVGILILVDPFLELGSGKCELTIASVNVSDEDWSNVDDFLKSIPGVLNLFIQ